MKKKILYSLLIVFIIILVFYFSLSTNFLFKHITINFINKIAPVNVTVEKWSFNPWKSIKADGLRISDISKETGKTNLYLSAESLNLKYNAFSFLFGTPKIHLVELNGLKMITTQNDSGNQPIKNAKSKKTHKKTKQKKQKIDYLSKFPIIIEKIVAKNCSAKYYNKNFSLGFNNLNLAAINISAQNDGTAILSGSFFYFDSSNVFLHALPFVSELDYTFDRTIIPQMFSYTMLISNVVGATKSFDFSPLIAEFNGTTIKKDKLIYLKKSLSQIFWADKQIASLSVTGSFGLADTILNLSSRLAVNSNDFFQSFIADHQNLDISQADFIGCLNTKADLTKKIYNCSGKFSTHNLKTKRNYDLPKIDFAGVFNITFNDILKQLNINKINFIINDKTHPMMQLKSAAPIVLKIGSAFKNAINTNDVAKIVFIMNKVKLKYLNDFIKLQKARFNAGSLSGKINCDIIGAGQKINLDSLILLNNINFSLKKANIKNLNIKTTLNASLKDLHFATITSLKTDFNINNNSAGEIAAGGYFDFKSKKEKIAIAATDISGKLFQPFIARKNKNINDLLFNIEFLSSQPEKSKVKNLSLVAKLTNPKALFENEFKNLNLNLNTDISTQKIAINNCELSLKPGKFFDNKLKLSGEFFYDKSGKYSELTLQAKHFDATALLDEFLPPKDKLIKNKKQKNHPKKLAFENKKRKLKNEPLPAKLKFINLSFKTHIDKLIARDIILSPLSFDLNLKSNNIDFITHNIKINDGNFSLNIQSDLNFTGFLYSANTKFDNIPITPILNSFVPDKSYLISGKLEGFLNLSGRGTSKKYLKKYFQGLSEIFIKDGRFGDVPILKDLAKLLKIQDLKDYSFDQCKVKIHSINGTNFIDDVNVQGKTIKLGANGSVTFDEQLDINVYLALSGKVIAEIFAKQGRLIAPFNGSLNKFYKLPMPIKILGTVSKPDIQADMKGFVATLVKAVGADLINVVNDIISGDKINKKNFKKTLKETGTKLLKNLFDELNNNITPKTKQYNLPHKVK